MRLRMPDLRAIAGGLIGAATATAAVLVADIGGAGAPSSALLVLMVALVGLSLGASAALYAYAAAGVILIVLAAVPSSSSFSIAELVRLGSFVIGSPFVVLLASRAEHERHEVVAARDASAVAEARADDERRIAVAARNDLDNALQRAELERAMLGEVAEAIPEPLIVYDRDGRGTYANRAALRVFGRIFVERPLPDWGRIAEPRGDGGEPLAEADWPQVAAQRGPLRQRMTLRLPTSGRDLLVDVEGTPVPGGGSVLLLRDVGREEDERQRLSRFASFVAHELRNPMAVARGRLELALREPNASTRLTAHAQRALDSVEAAIAVLERLEMYSRADTGRVEARREPFAVTIALDTAIERLRSRGSEREVRVERSGSTLALGDVQLASQAITNLLTNADRYSLAGAPIDVEVHASEPVTVRVADAGPGIADIIADRLFRDRISASRGLGLGLYLVRAMMEAQGGSVQLDERRPRAVFALRWQSAPNGAGASDGAEGAEDHRVDGEAPAAS